jgi:hypothetical protein
VDRLAHGAFALSFAVAAVMAVLAVGPGVGEQAFDVLTLAVSVALAVGVGVKAYKSKLGLDALVKHYAKAGQLYRTAEARLAEQARDDLGEDALGSEEASREEASCEDADGGEGGASEGGVSEGVADEAGRPPEGAARILVTLGREALLEHGDWLWTNQERDVDLPTVG